VAISASHSSPAFRHVAHLLHDPDEFSVAVSGGSLTADFLGRQEKPTRIEQFQSPAWAIDFHEVHVQARIFSGLPPGWASLGLMYSPAESTWYGIGSPSGTLVCTPPGQPIDGCTSRGFECVSVGISPALWERSRRLAAPGRPDFGGCDAYPLAAPVFHRLMQRLRSVRRQLREAALSPALAELAAEDAAHLVSELAVTAWEHRDSPPPSRDSRQNRYRLARRAEAWLRAHQEQPVSVPDLCLALRVSRRELEYAFRANFDLSPHAYLQTLRLNAIRRRLKRPGGSPETIAEVVLAHGFTHFGRFAANYRALFGEKPSETRRN
jgi:AraC family ethanolamine operon transcriptional activator